MDTQLFLGTSSWTADGWVGSFYPPGCKPPEFPQYYCTRFNTVEIDSTYYRIPSAKTVEQWRDRTHAEFVFAAKVPQIITHQKVLVDAEGDLKAFLNVMDVLGQKLGPILFQFPYFNTQKFRNLDAFIERLKPWLAKLPKGYQWAVEVRNKTWMSEKLYGVLRSQQVALALVDHAWMPRPYKLCESGNPITADFTYVRWLGDRKSIEKRTKVWNETIIDRTVELDEWARMLRRIVQEAICIYGYFNNHYAGHAPDTVRLFQQSWSAQSTAPLAES